MQDIIKAPAVIRRSLTTKVRVLSQAIKCGITLGDFTLSVLIFNT
jgi:hypothetical protein